MESDLEKLKKSLKEGNYSTIKNNSDTVDNNEDSVENIGKRSRKKISTGVIIIIVIFGLIGSYYILASSEYDENYDNLDWTDTVDTRVEDNSVPQKENDNTKNRSFDTIYTLRDVIHKLNAHSEIIKSNSANNLFLVFDQEVRIYHASTNRNLESIIEATNNKYFSKWYVLNDSLISVIQDESNSNVFNYTKFYEIIRKSDGKIFKYYIEGYIEINPATGKFSVMKDLKTEKLKSHDDEVSFEDFYTISHSAHYEIDLAEQTRDKLLEAGYQSGILYIPDFTSLSGVNMYLVYIGKFQTKDSATIYLNKIDADFSGNLYGILVSKTKERETFY